MTSRTPGWSRASRAKRASPLDPQHREAVNTWIRTSGAFDGVIDFDAVMRDPANPLRLNPAYDSGDHLHPNDAGYQAMADAINLDMLLPLPGKAVTLCRPRLAAAVGP